METISGGGGDGSLMRKIIESLRSDVSALQTRATDLEADVEKLKEHAILDSNYVE